MRTDIIPYCFRNLRKMSQNAWSAAVVIGVLRVKNIFVLGNDEINSDLGSFTECLVFKHHGRKV